MRYFFPCDTQVISACCVSFAHGANDVANSIGPFSAIYTTYTTYTLPGSSTTTEKWIFVFGGIGIVVGLLTYGYNIIMEVGCVSRTCLRCLLFCR